MYQNPRSLNIRDLQVDPNTGAPIAATFPIVVPQQRVNDATARQIQTFAAGSIRDQLAARFNTLDAQLSEARANHAALILEAKTRAAAAGLPAEQWKAVYQSGSGLASSEEIKAYQQSLTTGNSLKNEHARVGTELTQGRQKFVDTTIARGLAPGLLRPGIASPEPGDPGFNNYVAGLASTLNTPSVTRVVGDRPFDVSRALDGDIAGAYNEAREAYRVVERPFPNLSRIGGSEVAKGLFTRQRAGGRQMHENVVDPLYGVKGTTNAKMGVVSPESALLYALGYYQPDVQEGQPPRKRVVGTQGLSREKAQAQGIYLRAPYEQPFQGEGNFYGGMFPAGQVTLRAAPMVPGPGGTERYAPFEFASELSKVPQRDGATQTLGDLMRDVASIEARGSYSAPEDLSTLGFSRSSVGEGSAGSALGNKYYSTPYDNDVRRILPDYSPGGYNVTTVQNPDGTIVKQFEERPTYAPIYQGGGMVGVQEIPGRQINEDTSQLLGHRNKAKPIYSFDPATNTSELVRTDIIQEPVFKTAVVNGKYRVVAPFTGYGSAGAADYYRVLDAGLVPRFDIDGRAIGDYSKQLLHGAIPTYELGAVNNATPRTLALNAALASGQAKPQQYIDPLPPGESIYGNAAFSQTSPNFIAQSDLLDLQAQKDIAIRAAASEAAIADALTQSRRRQLNVPSSQYGYTPTNSSMAPVLDPVTAAITLNPKLVLDQTNFETYERQRANDFLKSGGSLDIFGDVAADLVDREAAQAALAQSRVRPGSPMHGYLTNLAAGNAPSSVYVEPVGDVAFHVAERPAYVSPTSRLARTSPLQAVKKFAGIGRR